MKYLLIIVITFAGYFAFGYELDVSGYGTVHRGNHYSDVYGSKLLMEAFDLEVKAFGEYQKFIEEEYHRYGAHIGYEYALTPKYGLFKFIKTEKDTTKKTDLDALVVMGTYYKFGENIKYSLGLGYEYVKYDEGSIHKGVVLSHRLKYKKKIKKIIDLSSVFWVYHFTNNMEISFENSLRVKILDNLRLGIVQEFEYNTNPGPDIEKEDLRIMIEGVLSFGRI